MKKYTYIVSYDQYITFESYKLDKITRISLGSKFLEDSSFFQRMGEIYQVDLETEYEDLERNSPIYNGVDYIFKFISNSGAKYRIDLLKHEDDKVDYKNMYSVLFSMEKNDPYKSTIGDYEEMTDKNEMIEVLNRIRFILKDWLGRNRYKFTFVIGKSEIEKKNNIYKYFIKICFPDYKIEYEYSSHYFDNKAFYIFK